ncbi:MAG: hypothetical protein AAF693_07950 [Bacteroidota bacterium]
MSIVWVKYQYYKKRGIKKPSARPGDGKSCGGRIRTFTKRLVYIAIGCSEIYPVIFTLETGGLVCQFQHSTL